MNAEDIAKALKCCYAPEGNGSCDGCPYGDDEGLCYGLNIEYHAGDIIESLLAQLAESQRRERAAVEDLELVCTVGESCFVCKNLENRGDDFPCIYGEWCMGEKWQWRGLVED